MLITDKTNSIHLFLDDKNFDYIGVQLYLTLKDNKKDEYYFSKEVNMSKEAKDFLKERIIKSLRKEMEKNENNFNLTPYDTEYIKQDALAYYTYQSKQDTDDIKSRIKLLRESFESTNLDNFLKGKLQIVRLNFKNEVLYFCFYKGTKKMTEYKRLGILGPDGLVISNENYIEIGGNFSFFWDKDNVYITSVFAFENTFDYKDHISTKSKEVLTTISNKDFFVDKNTKQLFLKKSSNAVFARGLAKLNVEVLDKIDELFGERTSELRIMYKNREKLSGNEKEAYISKIGKLNELMEYFDFNEGKIKIGEDDSPTVILHFFQNKIAQTFLTKEFIYV